MAEGGTPGPGMSFPLKVHTEDEDFVIEMDDNMASPPDGYGPLDGDRVRCKRRKRCGQCGPCQVKENCGKCHFCVRKDVLKQTCIYRKCVYLRSKPKPYSRPRHSPQLPATGRLSPPKSGSPVVKSPPAVTANMNLPFQDHVLPLPEPRGSENPFFPPHLPQQHMPPMPNSPFQQGSHVMPRSQTMPPTSAAAAAAAAAANMNMHMNMNPQSMIHTSPPINKLPEPPLVNSPHGAIGNLAGMPSMSERTRNDFRHPDQVPLPPHPHPHFPPVPHPSSHTHRESQMLGEPSRVPHMNFPSPVENRGTNDSSCMYHPSLPYNMPGHFHQPAGPSFLSGAPDMFRSQFLSSFTPGYSYPSSSRFREGFGSMAGMASMAFPSLNMASSAPFPQCAPPGGAQPFSQQYSPYNSQHGCPKNGCCPPASPSIETDAKVMQEGYKNLQRSNSESSVNSFWEPWKSPSWYSPRSEEVRSRISTMSSDFECDVISIDDYQMNALIRSDGCNSIEIEFDNSSVEDFHTPRKVKQEFPPVNKSVCKEITFRGSSEKSDESRQCRSADQSSAIVEKVKMQPMFVKGTVCLKQDLGDEGIVQLELPGHKVTLENTVLDDDLAKSSCDLDELLEFIAKKPQIEYVGGEVECH